MFRHIPSTVILLISLSSIQATNNDTLCDDFQANFDMKSVIGPWHVVAIVPETSFPDKEIYCYMVEFSETDGVSNLTPGH
jgi:hypothetical protein